MALDPEHATRIGTWRHDLGRELARLEHETAWGAGEYPTLEGFLVALQAFAHGHGKAGPKALYGLLKKDTEVETGVIQETARHLATALPRA